MAAPLLLYLLAAHAVALVLRHPPSFPQQAGGQGNTTVHAASSTSPLGLAPPGPLPTIASLNLSSVTVSGISSGAAFAVQVSVAFSSMVSGAAIFAGKPFQCEMVSNSGWTPGATQSTCNHRPDLIRLDALVAAAESAERADSIDPLVAGLSGKRYVVYRGAQDPVYQEVGSISALNFTAAFYERFAGAPNVRRVIDVVDSGHCVPTLEYGMTCASTGSPYLNKCDYDGMGSSLRWLLPHRKLVRNPTANRTRLQWFDQRPFFWGHRDRHQQPGNSSMGPSPGLGDAGAIFAPTGCVDGSRATCDLHVSFHGCGMDQASIGSTYVDNVGLLEYAESNGIVMLFPQTGGATVLVGASKPAVQHCWDNYGLTGADYSLRSGRQMAAIGRMLKHVLPGAARRWNHIA